MLTKTSSANGHAPATTATYTSRRRLPRTVRPARATRRVARMPSRIAIGALLVLAAVGVKASIAPRTASVTAPAAPATDARDITAQGFAQAFTRAYLSWDARDPEQHQRLWVLQRYGLRVSAARETGHHTHGDGTAVDLVPASGATQTDWDASAGRLASELGWTPPCGSSGVRPACALKPAIQFIGYDGYPSHGSPRTCTGDCPAHIHVSWVSGCYGSSALAPPCPWVMAFPAPANQVDAQKEAS